MVRDGALLAEGARRESRSHGASLPLLVAEVLARAGLGIDRIDALAVSIGPGSFTGLRIGLGWAKGVAIAGALPLVGVPTLEALAHVADAAPGEPVCAALDARKGEVYAALFAVLSDGVRRLTPDLVLRPTELAARLAPGTVLVGDAGEAYRDAFAAHATVRPFATHHPRGATVARLGAERLDAGEGRNAGELEPVYVRPPEAQLARDASRESGSR